MGARSGGVDPRVPGYLGRVLRGERGDPAGTGFQVVAGIVVTAWHVLDAVGAGEVDAPVWMDPLAGGAVLAGRTARIDPLHDLAVVVLDGRLPDVVAALASTDAEPLSSPVAVTGVAELGDPGHVYRFLDATGTMQGGATRDDEVMLARMHSRSVFPGMSGAPVRRDSDAAVVGVVSGRFNSVDGWGRDTVWLARVENLLPLLDGLASPVLRSRVWTGEALRLTLDIDEARVRLSGTGFVASAAHGGVSHALRDAVDRLRRARSQHTVALRPTAPAAQRTERVEGHPVDPVGPPHAASAESTQAATVGRLLAATFLPGEAGETFVQALAAARSRRVPLWLGVRVDGELARLPWETLWLVGEGRPLVLDGLVRLYRQVAAPELVATGGPLRILVAIASPLTGGSGLLDYERELRNVLKAVRAARANRAQVRVVHFATTEEIGAALRQWPAHVLHLSGHGGPGVLELEDDDGAARRVSAAEFVDEAIPPGRMPPVVALAACHTDAATATGDPSFAAYLLANGASVVVAAQTSITDVYATRVFARVYGTLAATPDADVVAAVADARVAVQRELERSTEDRDRRLAAHDEWAVLSVLSATAAAPLLDPHAPAAHTPPDAAGGVLRRETGEVVGRRFEQRRYPAQLRSPAVAGMVLHGVGGVGKTTLADELVARLLELDPDLVVAIVEKQTTADQIIDLLIGAYAARLVTAPRPDWATETVLRALATANDGDLTWRQRFAALPGQVLAAVPTLLVVDNFEDNLTDTPADGPRALVDGNLAALLAAFAAAPGRARLLITSRYRFTLPDHAEHALTFKPVLPLSYAETLKLAWALPHLDRLDDTELEQLWRTVGGHPRCLEYVDALLAGGHARFTDVRLRLVRTATRRLNQLDRPAADIDRYFAEHARLDDALAEAAALAADDVLLDQLLAGLAHLPDASRLLLGASVYRIPVDHHALAYQLGEPDEAAANTDRWRAAQDEIQRILTDAGIPPGTFDPRQLPAPIRAELAPHLAVRLQPPVRVEADLGALVAAGAASSLLTVIPTGGDPAVFMHRWTASELQRRHTTDGAPGDLVLAHRRAAAYWQWRVQVWPQPPSRDVDDLREAHHHLHTAADLGDHTALPDLAETAHHLELQLGRLGRRAEALTYSQQSVALKRELARHDEPTHIRDLGGFLNNLGARLSGLGRREEALAATAEAVEVYRRLAAVNLAAFEPNLAMALNSLGNRLSELGRREEALAATAEAVEVYRRLAAVNPVFEPDLATALNNLGIRLAGLGRREEALAATVEAVEVHRRLAVASPAAFEPALATALNNLGADLAGLGRREEALAATAEAVEIRRRLAAINPAAFEPDLASALNNLGNRLSDLGRREEALAATAEAVRVYRRLAAVNPAAFEPNLAGGLNNLGARLSDLGRWEEALATTAEAVEIRRRLAATSPAAFEPDLAGGLNSLGARLSGLGRREEALAATAEAVEVYRRLVAVNPAAFEPNLATALNNLGNRLSDLGRREEALAATAEAVEVYRRLAATNPAVFEPNLATALNSLGARLSDLGRREEALAATAEAVEVYRRLVAVNPAVFEPNLASALNNLGADLSGLGRWEEALVATAEAVRVYRRLAAVNPAVFEPNLASALNNLGADLSGLGRREEALAATAEAVEVYRRLAATNPAAFEPNLATALTNLAANLRALDRELEAESMADEAARLRSGRTE